MSSIAPGVVAWAAGQPSVGASEGRGRLTTWGCGRGVTASTPLYPHNVRGPLEPDGEAGSRRIDGWSGSAQRPRQKTIGRPPRDDVST
jgi:hypothetical protein